MQYYKRQLWGDLLSLGLKVNVLLVLCRDCASVPESFMRLGLVRYQEHAAEHPRVSEPVVEWVQLLPRRLVTMRYAQPRSGENGIPVEIEVRGHGTVRSALDNSVAVDEANQAMRRSPDHAGRGVQTSADRRWPHFEERALLGADGKPVTALDAAARAFIWRRVLRIRRNAFS